MRKTILATLLSAQLLAVAGVQADEREELLKLRATTLSLIEALVKEGVLSEAAADRLIQQAQQQAQAELQREPAEPPAAAPPDDRKVVRVPYVPDFVREEIREQVRNELREDVTQDVLAQAKNEGWGLPGVLPDWVSRIKLSGDLRLRAQGEFFDSNNVPDFDWQASNDSSVNTLINATENRQKLRARLRLGLTADITNTLKVGVRLTTGNTDNPVSTNQSLGNYGNRYELLVDQAYLRWDLLNADHYRWLRLWGGRMPNPWLASTDLVWDNDLGFEGLASTLRMNIPSGEGLYAEDASERHLFLTLGAFPLSTESAPGSDDKWLFGAQFGTDWNFANQSRLEVGLAYYDYYNIEGRPLPLTGFSTEWTVPRFMQRGNSVFDINGLGTPPYALVSDFDIVNLTLRYDLARFAPTHVILSADYARNIGFDEDEILRRTGLRVDPQTDAYQVGLTVGWPELRKRRDWQAFVFYRHVERDAVLDAFTDSDFHGGGTDAEGWILGGSYGLADNTWLTLKWMTADEIDGRYDNTLPVPPPLGIDVLQLDLNTKF